MKSFWVWQFGIRLVILALVLYIFRTGHGGVFTYLFSNQLSALLPASLLVSMLGVILCAAGVSFAVWARVHLGMIWGMPMSLREKPELVTSGPYQFVRHPIYSGFLIAMFGTALVDGMIWFLAFIIMGIYFIYSATREEKMMAEQFPDKYPEYKKRTKMLVPFVL